MLNPPQETREPRLSKAAVAALACVVVGFAAVLVGLAIAGWPDLPLSPRALPADAAVAALLVLLAAALAYAVLRLRARPARAVPLQFLLALLVLATALPLIVLLAYHLRYETAAEIAKADLLVQNLADVTVADTAASLTEFERIAAALADRPQVMALDAADCDPMAGELARLYPALANIATVTGAGQAVCSVVRPPDGVLPNIGQPAWLKDVVSRRRMAVGAPQRGIYSGRWVAVLGYPLRARDGSGNVAGAVELVVNLAAFRPLVSSTLPAGGVVGIIDNDGNAIARSFRPEEVVGRNLSGIGINRLVLEKKSGTAVSTGIDGVERLYAFKPVGMSGWYAVAGVPTASIYADARRNIWRSGALGLAALVAAAALVLAVNRRIALPMAALLQTARRVAAGHLDTRAPEAGPREVAEVAEAFNRMLERIPLIESGLKQSEAHYRTLFDASPDGLRVICDDVVVMINPAGLKLFGISRPEEIIGVSVYENIHPDYREQARDRVRHVIEGRHVAPPIEQVLLRADGTQVDVEVVSVPFEYQGRPAAVSIVHDLTARKAVERAVRRLNAELEVRVEQRTAELKRANQELEAFSYTVAHDLRSPLRGISGFAGLLREDHADRLGTEGAAYIERIASAANTMDALINGLLSLSRLGRAELVQAEVDLSALAATVAAQLAERDPERRVEFSIQPGLTAYVDRQLMQDVLENLMGNAWKFTSAHERGRIEFGAVAEGNRDETTYFVRDDGAGFDPGYAGKLFGTFQRLHNRSQFPGTGIGLASVRRVIENHGGRVWAEGAVEQGAVFYFALPRKRDE